MVTSESPDAQARRLSIVAALSLTSFVVLHVVLEGAAALDARINTALRAEGAWAIFVRGTELLLLVIGSSSFVFIKRRRRSRGATSVESTTPTQRWVRRGAYAVAIAFALAHALEVLGARLVSGVAPKMLPTLLAAHLSSTQGGIPWVAAGYLLGLVATAILVVRAFVVAKTAHDPSSETDPSRRTRYLGLAASALVFLAGVVAILYYGTGTRLLSGSDDDTSAAQTKCPAPPEATTSAVSLPVPSSR